MSITVDRKATEKEILKLRRKLSRLQERVAQTGPAPSAKACKQEKKIYCTQKEIAWLLLDMGENAEALAIYERLPWEDFSFDKAFGMARALIELKQYKDALLIIGEGLASHPNSTCLLNAQGNAYLLQGMFSDALSCFERALEFEDEDDPERHILVFSRANALYNLGDYQGASEIYRSLIDEHPEDPVFEERYAWCLYQMDKYEEAVRRFNALLRIGHSSVEVYEGLYWAYSDSGRENEAFEVAREAFRLFPKDDARVYIMMANSLEDTDNLEEAWSILQRGHELFPDDEVIRESLANFARLEGDGAIGREVSLPSPEYGLN